MSRNPSGTYNLPASNPVVSNTPVEAEWANETMTDIASAISDSLSRTGQGGMLAALPFVDGSLSAPGITFVAETTMGLYRSGLGQLAVAVGNSNPVRFTSGKQLEVYRDAAWVPVTAQTSFTGAIIVPVGTTAQRDVGPALGLLRFNTDSAILEYFDGADWINVKEVPVDPAHFTTNLDATRTPRDPVTTDANKAVNGGFYRILAGGFNAPDGATDETALIVTRLDANLIAQIATPVKAGVAHVYTRSSLDAGVSWSVWEAFYTANEAVSGLALKVDTTALAGYSPWTLDAFNSMKALPFSDLDTWGVNDVPSGAYRGDSVSTSSLTSFALGNIHVLQLSQSTGIRHTQVVWDEDGEKMLFRASDSGTGGDTWLPWREVLTTDETVTDFAFVTQNVGGAGFTVEWTDGLCQYVDNTTNNNASSGSISMADPDNHQDELMILTLEGSDSAVFLTTLTDCTTASDPTATSITTPAVANGVLVAHIRPAPSGHPSGMGYIAINL